MSVTDRLYRRVQMTSAAIVISSTDDSGPVHLVQGKVRGTPETIDNLQVVQLYGIASHAPVGSDAFVSFGNGDRSNGVVHATANQKARPRNQKPGEVTIFSDEGDAISLQRGNTVAISTKTAKVAATTTTSITSPTINLGAGSGRAAAGTVQLDNSHLKLAFPPSDTMDATTKGYVDSLHGGGGQVGPPGPEGPQGPPGTAATIQVGTTTTGTPGSNASVTNSGNTTAAIFNFTIPAGVQGAKGDIGPQGPASSVPGPAGAAATIAVGTTTTGTPGSNASVTNSGNSSAAVFNFTIPAGVAGATGATGAQGPVGPASTVPGPPGSTGATGPPGPTAVSTDAGNAATLGSDSLLYVPSAASAWTTGDVKVTLKTVADSGWVMMNDGTIGSATSGGTTRANADCQALFTLLWNNTTNANCAVSGGRGASASADWTANKTIALPKVLGRALAVAGAGSGLTSRALASILGEESHTLTTAELAAHNHGINETPHSHGVAGTNHTHPAQGGALYDTMGSGGAWYTLAAGSDHPVNSWPNTGATAPNITINTASTGITTQNNGSGTAHNNMQPSSFFNIMVKL